jgi:peroxiredoxin
MLRNILLPFILVIPFLTIAQSPLEILKRSYDSCQAVQNGYYEMSNFMKYMSGPDTIEKSFITYFKKIENDSIFSSSFHTKQFQKDTFWQGLVYTGNEFLRYYNSDSSGIFMSKEEWGDEIQAIKHNYDFYGPLTSSGSYPLPKDSFFIDDQYSFSYIGEEYIKGRATYHVRMQEFPEYDRARFSNTLKREVHYWIHQHDFIPVQYTEAYDVEMQNDTMYQFEKMVLDTYSINTLKSDRILQASAVPDYIKMETYVPYEGPELLPNDTLAPEWTLPDLDSNMIKLEDYQGELVLLDFFYKACYPCMKAIPALQSLHEKYGDQGFKLIGIDPYDSLEEGIAEFLEKRGVTYTVVLGGKDVAKSYRVSGYPTVYLIDQEGKVVFTQVGYGDDTEKKLEEVIKDHLSK